VEKFLFPQDEAHMLTLTDDQKDPNKIPTRANLLKALEWLVAGAKDGDSLFFHYSGHGSQVKDEDGDELDGFDECLVPSDFQQAGMLVDDIIHEKFVKNLPSGVRLTAIMDCCHSGSLFDLPLTYNIDGTIGSSNVVEVDNRKEAIKAAVKAGNLLFAGDRKGALKERAAAVKLFVSSPAPGKTNEAGQKVTQIKTTLADVIQFSGCKDEQTSADAVIGGKPLGAMSWAFIQAFKNNPELDYISLLKEVRNLLQGKYQQIPEMSCGRKLDLKTKFIM